jgi:hypothetical protein
MDASDRHRDHGRPESEIYKTLTPMPEPLVSPTASFLNYTPVPLAFGTSGLRIARPDQGYPRPRGLYQCQRRAPVFVEHWRYSCRQQCDYRRRPPAQHRSHHARLLPGDSRLGLPGGKRRQDSYTRISLACHLHRTRRCDGDRQPHSIRSERYKNQLKRRRGLEIGRTRHHKGDRARDLLISRRAALQELAKLLLEKEAVDRPALQAILKVRSIDSIKDKKRSARIHTEVKTMKGTSIRSSQKHENLNVR